MISYLNQLAALEAIKAECLNFSLPLDIPELLVLERYFLDPVDLLL